MRSTGGGPDEIGVDALDAPDAPDVADAPDAVVLDVLDATPDAPDVAVDAAPDADAQTDAGTAEVADALTEQDADATIDTADAAAPGTDAAAPDASDADDIAAGTDAVVACDPAACPTASDLCHVAVCNTDNTCGFGLATDGTVCNDGDACTTDACASGACVGAKQSCNDGNACTDDTCNSASGCVFMPNAATCDDSNACTFGDACTATVCLPGTVTACNDDTVCTSDSCNPTSGCVHAPNDVTCTDDNACTVGEACSKGLCQGALFADCNDTNPCTEDSCDPASGCSHELNAKTCDDSQPCTNDGCDPIKGCVHLPNSATCTDGNACTVGEACSKGLCQGALFAVCNDANPCTDDSCDPASGCVYAQTSKSCDDGNACTTADVCTAGTCIGGAAPDCVDTNLCTDDGCDPNKGCVHLNNTVPCDDKSVCTVGDVCSNGSCKSGPPLDCDDKNPCTGDACSNGCYHYPISGVCSDGNPCTSGDLCQNGSCASGSAYVCDDKIACTVDTCDGKGGCSYAPSNALCTDNNVCTVDTCVAGSGCANVAAPSLCEDGNPCSAGDYCIGTVCQPGAPKVCNDGDPCTDDSCDPASGCKATANTAICNDGSACTTNDVCNNDVCAGTAISCDDGIACTVDACVKSSGCSHTPDSTVCNDGEICTTDVCQTTGCKYVAAAGSCDDKNPCTLNDTCGSSVCLPGTLKVCTDGNPCTVDGCNAANGACVSLAGNDGATCDDNNACTVSDKCAGGGCAGTTKVCNDGNACTNDGCDLAIGCTVTNNTGICPNATLCVTSATCDGAGNCVATASVNCDDGNPCTTDACDGATGKCGHTALNAGACDDGNACTTGEACLAGVCTAAVTVTNVSTIAGNGTTGGQDGVGTGATFTAPNAIAPFGDGSMIVVDYNGHRVRRVQADGTVKTLAGTGVSGSLDGPALSATFANPNGVAVDGAGRIFISENNGHHIRKLENGVVTTFAGSTAGWKDGLGTAAQLRNPGGLVFDQAGMLYVADGGNHVIRRIAPDGLVSTFAGTGTAGYLDGAALTAQFNGPGRLAFANDGTLFIADVGNYRVRKLNTSGQVSTVAGSGASGYLDGAASSAKLGYLSGITVRGSMILLVDRTNARVRMIDPGGNVSTIAGSGAYAFADGAPSSAAFAQNVGDITTDVFGAGWMTDGSANERIRKLTFTTTTCNDGNVCTTDTCASNACTFTKLPTGATCSDGTGCTTNDACTSGGACVGTPQNCDDSNVCTTDYCNPITLGCSHIAVANFTVCNDNSVCTSGDTCFDGKCVASPVGTVSTIAGSGTAGYLDGAGTSAQFNVPRGLVFAPDGTLFVADTGNHRIRKVTTSGTVSTAAGSGTQGDLDGAASSAQFRSPEALLRAADGTVYISEVMGHRIRKLSPGGNVSIFVGSPTAQTGLLDGTGTTALFNQPAGMVWDGAGNIIVMDFANNAIRKVTMAGVVSTLAGGNGAGWVDGVAASAKFNNPAYGAIDPAGNLFITEYSNNRIRRLGQDGTVTTLLGDGTAGFSEAVGTSAKLNVPLGILWHPAGFLIFADGAGNRIRTAWPDGSNTTVAGNGTAGYIDGAGSSAELSRPENVALNASGAVVVSDSSGQRIRKIIMNQVLCNDNNPCTADSCDPIVGSCAYTPVSAGGGMCDDANPCTIDGCDANSGLCTHTAGNDGTTCEVNHTCGKCGAGVCGENLLSGSDEFNSATLGGQWSIIGPNSAYWSLSTVPGSLYIAPQPGDIWGTTNNPVNYFLQTAPTGSYEVITKVSITPKQNYADAQIVIWQDIDNWVRLIRSYSNGPHVEIQKETAASASTPVFISITDYPTVWLKLSVSAGTATGYFSIDGANWSPIGAVAAPASVSMVGLNVIVGGTGPYDAGAFDFFHVSKGCYP